MGAEPRENERENQRTEAGLPCSASHLRTGRPLEDRNGFAGHTAGKQQSGASAITEQAWGGWMPSEQTRKTRTQFTRHFKIPHRSIGEQTVPVTQVLADLPPPQSLDCAPNRNCLIGHVALMEASDWPRHSGTQLKHAVWHREQTVFAQRTSRECFAMAKTKTEENPSRDLPARAADLPDEDRGGQV